MGKGAPHVGFPEAVLGKYAEKLVSLGYKVRPATAVTAATPFAAVRALMAVAARSRRGRR